MFEDLPYQNTPWPQGSHHCYLSYDSIQTAIWHILSDLKSYTPEGFLESRPVKDEKVLSTSQTLNLLKQRGYIIKDKPLAVS